MEQIAVQNEWLFDRAGEDEMHLSFPGQTEDHHLSFSWRNNVETLQLSAQLEIKVPKQKRAEIAALINIVNEQLWLGHFRNVARQRPGHLPSRPIAPRRRWGDTRTMRRPD